MIASRRRRVQREPTIALINIVFLILIFFMVAGTLSRMPQAAFEVVTSMELGSDVSGDVLVVAADGTLVVDGRSYADVQAAIAAIPTLRDTAKVLPARALPGQRLLQVLHELRQAGAQRIALVAEKR